MNDKTISTDTQTMQWTNKKGVAFKTAARNLEKLPHLSTPVYTSHTFRNFVDLPAFSVVAVTGYVMLSSRIDLLISLPVIGAMIGYLAPSISAFSNIKFRVRNLKGLEELYNSPEIDYTTRAKKGLAPRAGKVLFTTLAAGFGLAFAYNVNIQKQYQKELSTLEQIDPDATTLITNRDKYCEGKKSAYNRIGANRAIWCGKGPAPKPK